MRELYVLFSEQVRDGARRRPSEELVDGLLHAWSAAWHPVVIHHCQSIPQPLIADVISEQVAGGLVIVPYELASARPELLVLCRDLGAQPLVAGPRRDAPDAPCHQLTRENPFRIDSHRLLDFYALGYAALQIENLARGLHFTSHYDPQALRERVVAAARAALEESSADVVKAAVQACFDSLIDIRHHFYPVDIYLLDWTLVEGDLHESEAERALSSLAKSNLWITGRRLQQLPDPVREALCGAVLRQGCSLAGIEEDELALTLWPADVAIEEVRRGQAIADQLLGTHPHVFARRRFGLSARLPMMLPRLGYAGAVHAVLDAGQFPQAAQPRTQWYGLGCAAVDAVACIPCDTRLPSTFFHLADRLGASIESDYVATACLAGRLGQSNCWYEDLRRACRWTAAIGRFVTFDDYLRQTSPMGQHADFPASGYVSPYLGESIPAMRIDPVSRWRAAWRHLCQLEAAETMTVWTAMLRRTCVPADPSVRESIDRLRKQTVLWADPATADGPSTALPPVAAETTPPPVVEAAQQLAEQLVATSASSLRGDLGQLVINPTSQPLRIALAGPPSAGLVLEGVEGAHAGHRQPGGEVELVVDVPSQGFQWLPSRSLAMATHDHAGRVPTRAANDRLIASEWQLCNEFLRARVDPESGGLAGLYSLDRRENRLSQRLFDVRETGHQIRADEDAAPHEEEPAGELSASRMLAEELQIETNSPVRGAIVVRGRVVTADGATSLRFSQRFELWQGMRHLTLDIALETLDRQGTPWRNYIASRVAWRSPHARLSGLVQEMSMPMSGPRFDSPLGFEIIDDERRTWVQSLGLPFHRRVGPRQCDTILVCQGETQRHFSLRFCVEPISPLASAISAVSGPLCHPAHAAGPLRGWFLHVDARQVVTSSWRTVWRDESAIGLRVRLWESSGQTVTATIRAARPLRFAQKCDFLGDPISICPVEDGAVRVTLAPFEWTDLECHW